MRNRELEAFLSLGKKKDGTYFTPEDIRSFNTSRQAHKTKFKSTVTIPGRCSMTFMPYTPVICHGGSNTDPPYREGDSAK